MDVVRMDKLFIFDFDDTLANFSMYNTWVLKQPIKLFPHIGKTLPGAVEVLDFLRSKRDRVEMLSMNIVLDDDLKWRKLERVGMRRWFNENNSHFVRHKTPEKILEICSKRKRSKCFMVGNSFDHDVLPALEAGINAIYIPRPWFTAWVPRRLPRNERLWKLKKISQIMDIYNEL
jgi:FMN phosphatase YigB (HAD superfamily)